MGSTGSSDNDNQTPRKPPSKKSNKNEIGTLREISDETVMKSDENEDRDKNGNEEIGSEQIIYLEESEDSEVRKDGNESDYSVPSHETRSKKKKKKKKKGKTNSKQNKSKSVSEITDDDIESIIDKAVQKSIEKMIPRVATTLKDTIFEKVDASIKKMEDKFEVAQNQFERERVMNVMRHDKLDQYTRRDNLILIGMKEQTEETTDTLVEMATEACAAMTVEVKKESVTEIRRIGKETREKNRPVFM